MRGPNLGSQHTENLFRRYKGEVVTVKTISGGVFEGRISEVTNDYVSLVEPSDTEKGPTYIFYAAVESLVVLGIPTGT
jgi:hypothetical protein